jgi:hypothetical protein
VVAVRARMQVSRSFPRQEEGPRTGGNRQGEHPLHVPRHGDEGPLTSDIFEPTQQELAEAHHRFDDPEHRLRDLVAQGIEASCLRASADGGSWLRAASGSPAPTVLWQSAPTRADNATGGPAQSSDPAAQRATLASLK